MKRDVINCKRKIFGSCGHLYYINTRSCVSSAGVNVGTRTLSLKGVFSLRTFHWVSFEGITMMSHASLGIFSTFSLNLFSWIFSKKRSKKKFNSAFSASEIHTWSSEWVRSCDETMAILIFFPIIWWADKKNYMSKSICVIVKMATKTNQSC